MEAKFEKSHGRMQGLHERRNSSSFKSNPPQETLQCITILDFGKDEDMLTVSLQMLLGCTKSLAIMSRPVPKASLVVRGQRLRC